jgi:DNA-directed RNA polymerase specialized sigma24 family protein
MFLADAEVPVRRNVVAQLGSFGNVDDTVQDSLVAIDRRLENGGLGDRPVVAFVAQVTRAAVEDAWRRVAADLEQPTREFPDVADPRPGAGQWIESMDIRKRLPACRLMSGR